MNSGSMKQKLRTRPLRLGRRSPLTPHSPAFTLLEMTLAMFIFSLLIAAVFVIVRAVTQLSNDLTVEQQRDARTHAFVEMGTRILRSLPPEAMVRLRTKQTGSRYLGQLVLAGAASPLTGGGGGVTVLETEEAPDGYLRLVLRSLAPDQALAWEKGDSSAGVRVLLLENVAMLEWKFFNVRSGEWEPVWNDKLGLASVLQPELAALSPPPADGGTPGENPPPPGLTPEENGQPPGLSSAAGQRPSLIELRFALGAEPPQRWVFWTPPATAR